MVNEIRKIGWIRPVLVVCAGIALLFVYSGWSTLEQRITMLESQLDETGHGISKLREANEEQANELASNLDAVTQRLDLTSGDLQKAKQQLTQRLRQQQQVVEQKLANELAVKANSTDVETLRLEAASKLAEVQQDASAKLGNVSGEVTVVKQDLAETRQNLSRDLLDVKNSLSDGIARNAAELAVLRKRGERDYYDVDIRRNQKPALQRIADVQMSVTKTDTKRQKYTVVILADDSRIEKKDRTANEPIQFLVGRDRLRYELVINAVDKDRIVGYISVPKDKVLSAEGPSIR